MFPRRLIVFAFLGGLSLCPAQSPVRFSTVDSGSTLSTTAGGTPSNIYIADLNNDGLPDLIQDIGESPDQFTVSIAAGNGKFKPPVYYSYPVGGAATPRAAMTFGDFNGDGKLDLVLTLIGTSTTAIYLGNGDGTLQAPITNIVNVYFYGPDIWGQSSIVAADFNADGKLDLAAASGDYLHILQGNGDGTFNDISALLAPSTITGVLTGDFNRDGHADVAYVTNCCPGTTVTVLWGHGTLGFGPLSPITFDVPDVVIGSGDLDGDGSTDLIAVYPGTGGVNSNGFMHIAYGHSDGNFTFYHAAFPSIGSAAGSGLAPRIAAADFNGDGRMDFALAISEQFLVFFLGSPGSVPFTDMQTWTLPSYAGLSNAVLANFNRDPKPDLALVQYNAPGDSAITTELNGKANGLWSNCPYPVRGRGISLCSPVNFSDSGSTATTPVDFSATAAAFGTIRKMELWVDGKKMSEQSSVWGNNPFLHMSAALPAGLHQGTIFAANTDASLQKLTFSFDVGEPSCAPPAQPGVQICSLSSNGTFTASANIGTPARMELWADGGKEYTAVGSSYLAATIPLTPGKHAITVVGVNSDGQVWQQSINQIFP